MNAPDLKLVGQKPTSAPELARQQVAEAIARGRMDLSGSPRWPWSPLDGLTGPMLPGEFWVIAALTGNGKSSFLMSAMDHWSERQTSTLYIPLEVDPQEMRRRWAAWKLGIDVVRVLRNEWLEGEQDAHEAELEAQATNPYVHFAPDKHITLAGIQKWTRWAHSNLGVRQVVLDHFQRVDHGGNEASHRLAVHDTARALRDLARELGIVVITAAQINRNLDPLDACKAPLLARVKDAAGISEEASGVLMLSRKLLPDIGKEDMAAVRSGQMEEWKLCVPNTMQITCRKHRLDDHARDRRVDLFVRGGRVTEHRYSG